MKWLRGTLSSTVHGMPVERLPLDEESPWWGEHRSRYRYAAGSAAGRSVLDIACGTGYGSLMLANAGARFVAGCDVSLEALRDAARVQTGKAVAFLAANGEALPFPDKSFELVVSFETLEHVTDGRAFIRELRRVLQPSGVLLLSTPNADVTRNYPPNPFHVREYHAVELSALLQEFFGSVHVMGQTLTERHAIAPFLPGYDRAEGFPGQLRLIAWKLLRRLPRSAGRSMSRLILRRELYPSEADYRFGHGTTQAHVLVARCLV